MNRLATTCALAAILFLVFSGSRPSVAASQSNVTLSYSVIGGGQFQPPTLWYFSNGQNVTTLLKSTPVTYTTDFQSPWGVSKLLPGAHGPERWEVNGSSSGVVDGKTHVLTYYRQYYATFGAPDLGTAGSSTPPNVTFSSLGTQQSLVAGEAAWADYLSPYTYSYVIGTVPGTRFWVASPTGVVMSAALINPAYKEQFLLTFKLTTQGPDHLHSTTLIGKQGGSPTNQTLTAPGGSFWVDSKSSFTFPTTIYSASGANRWSLSPLSEKVAVAPANLEVLYYEQYPFSVTFSVSEGVAPSPPVLSSTSVAQGFSLQLIAGAPPTWVDAGSNFTISSLLSGSSSAERWVTEGGTSGVVNGPTIINIDYFHQVQVGFSYSVAGGGTISPSNASFFSFGVQRFVPLTTTEQGFWADVGTALAFRGSFVGSSPLERWELGTAPTSTIRSPEVLSLVYYHQFLVPIVFGVSGGGGPGSPELTGFESGAPYASAVRSGSSAWLDSGTLWSVSQFLQGPIHGERWAAIGVVNGTIGATTFVALSYQHQYLVELVANPPAGGNPGTSSWVSAGGSLGVIESPNTGWKFAGWSGTGGPSYSGMNQAFSLVVSSPIKETANFDVGFVVHVSGSGNVQVSFGTSSYSVGGQLTFYVPAGTKITMIAKPGLLQSFAGWQGIPGGNVGAVVLTAAAPTGVNAVFVLNQVEALGLAALYWGVAIYVIAYLVWNKHISPRQLWDSLRRRVTIYD